MRLGQKDIIRAGLHQRPDELQMARPKVLPLIHDHVVERPGDPGLGAAIEVRSRQRRRLTEVQPPSPTR